jgi:hypothetical protein
LTRRNFHPVFPAFFLPFSLRTESALKSEDWWKSLPLELTKEKCLAERAHHRPARDARVIHIYASVRLIFTRNEKAPAKIVTGAFSSRLAVL